jgi:glycosyltransferase involved in cell wall biosynthesis
MCTHNGAPHVADQVRSIIEQLEPDDELIVSDDASSDETVERVLDIASTSAAPIHIAVNGETKGVIANFEGAIGRGSGDIVVLADQDDVWHPDKIALVRREFAARPDLLAVFSNARLLEGSTPSSTKTLWQANGVDRFALRRLRKGLAFEQLLRRNVVTGATMAFRSQLVPDAMPFPTVLMHDYWLALVAASLGSVRAIEAPLIDYRVHRDQQIGPEPLTVRAQAEIRRADPTTRSRELEAFIELRQRVTDRISTRFQARLDAKIRFLAQRVDLAPTIRGRLPGVMADIATMRYHRFARGFRSAARDLIIGH